jgi:hypothetical protein
VLAGLRKADEKMVREVVERVNAELAVENAATMSELRCYLDAIVRGEIRMGDDLRPLC